MLNITEIQHRLALKFRINKIDNGGIFGPILLYEILKHKDRNISCEIIEGYLKIHTPDNLDPEICWHIWVESNGQIYDINKVMAIMNEPSFKNCEFLYERNQEDKPDEDENIKQLKENWELYKKKEKTEFWKLTPIKIRNFRAKIFREINKK